jgi:alanine racemase
MRPLRPSRRAIFRTAGLAAASVPLRAAAGPKPAAEASGPARCTPDRDSAFDPWVEVNAAHFRHNVAEVRRRVGGRPVLAVIKNNGYGAGVVNAARALEGLSGVAGLCVVKLHEAVALREAGIRSDILLLGPLDDRDLAEAAARRVTPMIYTPVGEALDRAAARAGRPVDIQVCIDTGIGRVGVPVDDAPSLIRDLADRRGARITGAMMTFTEEPDFDRVQLERFLAFCRTLEAQKILLGRKHAASSYTLFQGPDAYMDMVRPGMAVFGVYPEKKFRAGAVMDLKPAVALRARIAYVKQLRAGQSAGYNRAYRAAGDVWLATLPVGHADGYPRTAAKGAKVRIGGRLFPVIASVSASHTIVELGAERAASIGDVATLFDWEPGSRPEDVSEACGASVYDLLMHLNPLLPRRMVGA